MLVFSPEKINADDGSPGDGRKYIVYAVLTLFFLLVMLALVDIIPVLSTDSRACAGCHEMNREYSTWQISTHSKVDCINCHMQSDWNGLANFKLKQTVWTLKHYSGLYGKGSIELKGTIVNETCLKCHSLAKVTPSGDLIIPHDRHLDEEVACITCHVGLVHRQEQPVTAKNQNYQVIVDNELLVQVKPKMYVCLRCHERKRVTTECNACHTRLELPQQHKRADWGVIHGVSAYQQVEPCLTCHTEQTEKAVIGGSMPVVLAARNIKFCVDCHQQRPPVHNKDWQLRHGQIALNRGQDYCFVCHDINKPSTSDGSVGTYCNQCHHWE